MKNAKRRNKQEGFIVLILLYYCRAGTREVTPPPGQLTGHFIFLIAQQLEYHCQSHGGPLLGYPFGDCSHLQG